MTPLQQQAQRLAARTQADKQQQNRRAETEPRQQPAARRQPSPTNPHPPAARAAEKPLRHGAEQGDKTRRSAARERSSAAADTPFFRRSAESQPAQQEASLFSELLDGQPTSPLEMGGAHFDWSSGQPSLNAKATESAAPAMASWHQLEPSLNEVIEKQPSGPVSMTLLLPKLGEVDARLSGQPGGAGWDISLRFAPQALAMMAPHHERCRESLRRRMACRVRLRFEQREATS